MIELAAYPGSDVPSASSSSTPEIDLSDGRFKAPDRVGSKRLSIPSSSIVGDRYGHVSTHRTLPAESILASTMTRHEPSRRAVAEQNQFFQSTAD